MSLIWMDGFDHYTTDAQLVSKGYQITWLDSAAGRFDGRGQYCQLNYGNLQKTLDDTYITLYIGAAFWSGGSVPQADTTSCPLRVLDEAGLSQVSISVDSDRAICAYRGSTLIGTGTVGKVPLYGWMYIEAKITISATVGIVLVNVNEQEALNLTGANTKNGTDYIKRIRVGSIYPNTSIFDDFYVDDSQFHGNCHIKTFMPDSDGTHSDFVRSTGSADYEPIDEIPPVDSDYIFSNTVGHKSTFGITTGVLTTVKAIQLNNRLALGNVGARTVKPLLRSNGTDYAGAIFTDMIDAGAKFYARLYELDPDDSGAWTQAKLEAAEFGLEIAS